MPVVDTFIHHVDVLALALAIECERGNRTRLPSASKSQVLFIIECVDMEL